MTTCRPIVLHMYLQHVILLKNEYSTHQNSFCINFGTYVLLTCERKGAYAKKSLPNGVLSFGVVRVLVVTCGYLCNFQLYEKWI